MILSLAAAAALSAAIVGWAGAQTVSSLATPSTPEAISAQINAAITAATPPDCPAPLPDALVATAGTQPRCMRRADAASQTLVQAVTVITDADGGFSGDWPAPFPSGTPTGRIAAVELAAATASPHVCSFYLNGVTATGFRGKCWQVVGTTLPTTVAAVLGLTVSPIQSASSGLTVRVTGRQ